MNKRMFLLMTLLLLLVGLVTVEALPSNAQTNGDFAGGSGTESDPYIITTPKHLENISKYLGTVNQDKHFALGGDIDLSDYGNWTPIGSASSSFDGTFDGRGYIITGLKINGSSQDYGGLFGYVRGHISNVGLKDVHIEGDKYVGAISGYLVGGEIRRSYVLKSSLSGQEGTGALVGMASSFVEVSDSYAKDVAVIGKNWVGGLVGYNFGQLSNSYFTHAEVNSSYGTGLTGNGPVTASFWSIDKVTCNGCTFGGTGGTEDSNMKRKETYTEAHWCFEDSGGCDEAIWGIDPDNNDGYPYLLVPKYTANLNALKINDVMFPGFQGDQYDYTLVMDAGITKADITATTADSRTTVKMNGEIVDALELKEVTLFPGENVINIQTETDHKDWKGDKQTKDYTLTITVKEPPEKPSVSIDHFNNAYKGGEAVTLTITAPNDWGSDPDPENHKYVVELYDGKAWEHSKTFTVSGKITYDLPASINIKEAKLRVQSKTDHGESGYVEWGPFMVISTPPTIALNGEMTVRIVKGDTFIDPGVKEAKDVFGGGLSVTTSGDVDNTTIDEYTVTYTVTDAAGNEAEEIRTVIVAPPPVTISGGFETITVSGAEAGAELSLFNSSDDEIKSGTANSDGDYVFTDIPTGTGYHVIQTVNSIESEKSNAVKVDAKAAPESPTSLTLNPSPPFKGGKITVSWDAINNWGSDPDPENHKYVVELYDGNKWGEGADKYPSDTSAQITIPQDINVENAKIRVKSVTGHGESSWIETDPFIIDNIKPAVKFEPDKGEYAQSHVTSVTVEDELSGVNMASLYYLWSEENDKELGPDAGWIRFDNEDDIRIKDENGDWYLHIKAEDNAGNAVYKISEVFKLDNGEPSIDITLKAADNHSYDSGTWTNQVVTLSVTVENKFSKAVKTEISLDDGAAWETYVKELQLNEGKHTIKVRAVNEAGGTSEKEVEVWIDTSAPDIQLSENGSEKWSARAETKVTITDDHSGVDENTLRYIWTNSTDRPADDDGWEPFESGEELTLSGKNGEWYLHIFAKDQAGNEKYVRSEAFRLRMPSGGGGAVPEENLTSETRTAKIIPGRAVQQENIVETEITRTEQGGMLIDEVTFDRTEAEEVVQRALHSEESLVRLIIDDLPDAPADEMIVQVDSQAVHSLNQAGLTLAMEIGGVLITLPQETLQGIGETGEDLYFRVVPIRQFDERQTVLERVTRAEEVLQYTEGHPVRIVGQPMTIETNYRDHKTTVALSLEGIVLPFHPEERDDYLEKLAIFIEHSDGENVVKQGSVVYDEGGNPLSIQFEIDKFSTFTMVTTADEVTHYIERLSGENRYVTSLALSAHVPDHSLDTIVLASGRTFPDALVGGTLVHALNGTVLLIDPEQQEIDERLIDEIKRLLKPEGRIILLGGPAAIPDRVTHSLSETLDDAFTIERLFGSTRIETALAIAEKVNPAPEHVFIVSGNHFADALSIVPYANQSGTPILLNRSDQGLDQAVENYLIEHDIKRATVIGGPVALPEALNDHLKKLGIHTERLFGANRYLTALEIAKRYYPETTQAAIASGFNFPDALSAGRIAYDHNIPILLSHAGGLEPEVEMYLKQKGIERITLLGGRGVLPDNILDFLRD